MNAARNTRGRDSRGLRATRSGPSGSHENPGPEREKHSCRHQSARNTQPSGRGLFSSHTRLGASSARFQNRNTRYRSEIDTIFFPTVYPYGSTSREGNLAAMRPLFSFLGATRARARHNSHGHQHRRLSPTLHQQPCVKSSPSTSARPVSRPVTRAGSCTASSTVSSLSTSTAGATSFPGSFKIARSGSRNCRDRRGRKDANRATRDAREGPSVAEQSREHSPRRFRAHDRRATSTARRAVRATVRARPEFPV